MSQYSRFVTSILLLFAMASMGRISAASTTITGSLSVKLSNVVSTMSDDVKDLYESTMATFYQNNLKDLSNITVTVMLQGLESTPATRLRRLQSNAPLTTLLMVSGIPSDTSIMTEGDFSSQLVDTTTDQNQIVVYLLKAADPSYFGTLANVVGSSLTSTEPDDTPKTDSTTPEANAAAPAPIAAPVPAPVKAPVPAPVMVPGPFFNNPQGVKVSISIAALWFIAVTLGVGILFLYPEEKVPDNWKAVSSS